MMLPIQHGCTISQEISQDTAICQEEISALQCRERNLWTALSKSFKFQLERDQARLYISNSVSQNPIGLSNRGLTPKLCSRKDIPWYRWSPRRFGTMVQPWSSNWRRSSTWFRRWWRKLEYPIYAWWNNMRDQKSSLPSHRSRMFKLSSSRASHNILLESCRTTFIYIGLECGVFARSSAEASNWVFLNIVISRTYVSWEQWTRNPFRSWFSFTEPSRKAGRWRNSMITSMSSGKLCRTSDKR